MEATTNHLESVILKERIEVLIKRCKKNAFVRGLGRLWLKAVLPCARGIGFIIMIFILLAASWEVIQSSVNALHAISAFLVK
jgi:hypothetical protein